MQVFKFFLLMVIWALSTLIGIIISKKFANRVVELKEIKNALNIIETKIKFTYQPLPEIFDQISEMMSKNISSIFTLAISKMETQSVEEAWEYAVNNAVLDVNVEDKKILSGLGNLLRQNRCGGTS